MNTPGGHGPGHGPSAGVDMLSTHPSNKRLNIEADPLRLRQDAGGVDSGRGHDGPPHVGSAAGAELKRPPRYVGRARGRGFDVGIPRLDHQTPKCGLTGGTHGLPRHRQM